GTACRSSAAPCASECQCCLARFGLWLDSQDWDKMCERGPCPSSWQCFGVCQEYGWTCAFATNLPHHGLVQSYPERTKGTKNRITGVNRVRVDWALLGGDNLKRISFKC